MTALSGVPVRRIVAAIGDAAARWADADFPPRVRLLDAIAERTGYSIPVVEYALDQIFFTLTEHALEETIATELGAVDRLDQFDGGRRAMPAGAACIISSRTTIGVAIVPAVFALCAKCDVTVKDREDCLVRTFFASLAQELPELQAAAQARVWSGEEDETSLLDFDVVAAFGTDATLKAIRGKMRADSTLLAYGSKASAGYVSRASLGDESAARHLASGAARDVVLYDTQGCMSLHILFVERGTTISTQDFGALLAAAIERAAVEFPPGPAEMAVRTRVAQLRDLAAFRAAAGTGCVFSDREASFLILVDPPASEPPPFLARTVLLLAVDGPQEALAYLRAHGLRLEAIASDAAPGTLSTLAEDFGAARLCRFGEMQRPPLSHPHGGIGRIAPFVRWIGSQ